MPTESPLDELARLLELLDQAFDRTAWHGPNLRGSIRGLSAADAAWRPRRGRHSVAEQVLHAAYWKYVARRRLTGARRGSFAREGSNWFPVEEDLDDPSWKGIVRLLEAEHRALREAVAGLTTEELGAVPPGSKVSRRALVQGIAFHDVYHAGQIGLLKRLREGDDGGA